MTFFNKSPETKSLTGFIYYINKFLQILFTKSQKDIVRIVQIFLIILLKHSKNMASRFLIAIFAFIQTFLSAQESVDKNLKTIVGKANTFCDQLRYDSAEVMYLKAFQSINPENEKELYLSLKNKHALCLLWQDKLVQSKKECYDNLENCIRLLGNHHLFTADAYLNLGTYKMMAASYENVEADFLMAAFIYEDIHGKNHPSVAKAYEWLGTYMESNADTVNSKKYLMKSFHLWKKIKGADHPDLAEIYRYLGLYYKRFMNHDSAIYCFNKAKLLFDKKYGPANFLSIKCLNNLAAVYSEHPQMHEKVLPAYKHCIELASEQKSQMRMAWVMTWYNLASHYITQQNYTLALEYLNKVLARYYPDFKPENIFDNPAHVADDPHPIAMLTLISKANVYAKLIKNDTLQKIKLLKEINKCQFLADQIIDERRKTPNTLDDFLFFSHRHAKIYYHFAINAFNTYKETGEEFYFDEVIRYFSKINLQEEFLQVQKSIWEGNTLPKYISEKEIFLQKEINQLKATMAANPWNSNTERELIEKITELQFFNHQVFQEYYQSLKTKDNGSSLTVNKLQSRLGPDESILWYVDYREDNTPEPEQLFILAINKHEVSIFPVDGKNTFRLVQRFKDHISEMTSADSLKLLGSEIYHRIVKPVENILTKNIIIIPSAHIRSLPFNALPDYTYSTPARTPYFLENRIIRKEFSLRQTEIHLNNEYKMYVDSILTVAPLFDKSQVSEISLLTKRDTSLINLPGAIAECKEISAIFKAYKLIGFEATESTFKQVCNRFSCIHLSTHGIPGNGDKTTMQLAFSRNHDNQNDGWLSFYEILNLELKTDLVVLSACKTGQGKVNNAEGSLNLAWAFNKAGVNSAIISLWDVNDYASSHIMTSFYKNLRKGMTKPEALQQAKIEYLQTNDELMNNPYYWAGFDYYGNDSKFVKPPNLINSKKIMIFLTAAIVVVAILLFLKNRLKHITF